MKNENRSAKSFMKHFSKHFTIISWSEECQKSCRRLQIRMIFLAVLNYRIILFICIAAISQNMPKKKTRSRSEIFLIRFHLSSMRKITDSSYRKFRKTRAIRISNPVFFGLPKRVSLCHAITAWRQFFRSISIENETSSNCIYAIRACFVRCR